MAPASVAQELPAPVARHAASLPPGRPTESVELTPTGRADEGDATESTKSASAPQQRTNPALVKPHEPASVAASRVKAVPDAAYARTPETWPALSDPQQSAEAVACEMPQQCASPQASEERGTTGASSCADEFTPTQSGSPDVLCSAHTKALPATTAWKGPATIKKVAPSVAETAAAAVPRRACPAADAAAKATELAAPKQ